MRNLIILLALVASFFILRYLFRQSSLSPQKIIRSIVIFLALALFVFLLITGRLHWLFALAAAAIPAIMRLLPLLRYVPLLRNLYRRYQAGNQNAPGGGSGQTSTVQSDYLRMVLNHDSGDMDGDVLLGQFQGKKLGELSLEQLMSLMRECQGDGDSVALLSAYLDRMHEDWREKVSEQNHHQQGDYQGSSQMSQQEALQILGLEEGASEQDIVQAHRRLMQKLHPDHGGSTYLSAKINLAKDVLLGKK